MGTAALVLATALSVGSAGAYEETAVVDGGGLSGRVFLDGPVPPARIFHLIVSPNPEFCGRISDGNGNRLLEEFRVAPDGGFADVVVALVGVERGKPFDYAPKLEIQDCRIGPWVKAVRNRQPVTMINRDPIAHDIQAYTLNGPYTFPMFNKPIEPETTAVKMVKLRPNHYLFRTQCGVHAFMQSWGFAVGNPYFAVTSDDGRFTIDGIPPGEYHLIAWHALMDVQATRVRIEPGAETPVEFRFDAAGVTIPLHDLQQGYRFDTVLQPGQIQPPLEPQ